MDVVASCKATETALALTARIELSGVGKRKDEGRFRSDSSPQVKLDFRSRVSWNGWRGRKENNKGEHHVDQRIVADT